MTATLINRVRRLITDGGMSPSGLARAAGVQTSSLRDLMEDTWSPTADTLDKLERFVFANDEGPTLVPIQEVIEEARNGRMFILVDDEDRENEGDLIIPAQMATPNAINFMATHGRGLICLAMTQQRIDELGLPPMAANNGTSMGTAFTVSIEAREGVTTGISAADRARTIAVAIDSSRRKDAIVTPGHVFPLAAREGGVLVRAGHTEAAVDISRLAGLNPSGVICEIMKDDGTMARMDDMIAFARLHGLKIGTIRDLIEYRMRHDHLVEKATESLFKSDYGGDWRAISFRNKTDGWTNLVLQKGEVDPLKPTLVRMHAVSVLDDLLGRPGEKKRMLQRSMSVIGEAGAGVIVILIPSGPDALQYEITGANREAQLREYGIGAQILAELGIQDMILLTNSPRNVVGIGGYGLRVVCEQAIPET